MLRIAKLKKMILRFEKIDKIAPLIRKCHFLPKGLGNKFLDLQKEYSFYLFGYSVNDGYGSEYSLRQKIGKIRQLLAD